MHKCQGCKRARVEETSSALKRGYLYEDQGSELEQEGELVSNKKNPAFKLYPNPSNGQMTLEYELLKKGGWFVLNDLSGKEIVRLELSKGKHRAEIEQGDINNGIYIYRIINNDYEQEYIDKLIIIK